MVASTDFDRARSRRGALQAAHAGREARRTRRDEAFGCPLRKPPRSPPTQETTRMLTPRRKPTNSTPTKRRQSAQCASLPTRAISSCALFPDDAPMHGAAFSKLVEAGFYDGLAFHRVEPGFVVQGGRSRRRRHRRPGLSPPAEFNARSHCAVRSRWRVLGIPNSRFAVLHLPGRGALSRRAVYRLRRDGRGFEALDKIRRGDKMNRV